MEGYTPFEVRDALESMKILVDTREQDTAALRARLEAFSCPWERRKLDFGDYGCAYITRGGEPAVLPVAVERKMSLDELCACFTKGLARFEREFLRAKEAGGRLYLLCENASWEKVLCGRYRSRMNPDALAASILAWSVRYGLQLLFCKPEHTGTLIQRILRYELKELLEVQPNENNRYQYPCSRETARAGETACQ